MLSVCTIIAFVVMELAGTATNEEEAAMPDDSYLLRYEPVQSGCIFGISKSRTMKHIASECIQSCREWMIANFHTVRILDNYRDNVLVKPFSLFCTYKE